jgi:serine/threonine protein kinase
MPSEHYYALPIDYCLRQFVLKKQLGQGNFGLTYLAWDKNLDRWVAIKELLPLDFAFRARDGVTVVAKSPAQEAGLVWARARFLDEAKTLAKLQHPSIVQVYEQFEANSTAYLVMEYIEGEDLEQWLRKNPNPSEENLKSITCKILQALQLVHRHEYLHRDVKPDNIRIRKDSLEPVLIDFGNARMATGLKTSNLSAIVTFGYAPFEQYQTTGKQGPWTDVYAFGAVLYRAIVGKPPPQATDRHGNDSIIRLAHNPKVKGYSPAFLAMIDKALSLRADERWQTCGAWLAAIPDAAIADPPIGDGDPYPFPWNKALIAFFSVLAIGAGFAFWTKWETWKPPPQRSASVGSISGTVSSDDDGDGRADAGLAGVRLELQHSNGTPVDGDSLTFGVQPKVTTTDSHGNYQFDQVAPGDYLIVETQPPGYDSISDSDGGNRDVQGDKTGLTLVAGATLSGIDFLERPQTTPGSHPPSSSPQSPQPAGAITGSVLADTDGDGKVEPGSGIVGVNIELLDDNNAPLKRTQTNAQGGYEFKELSPGAYQVRQTQPRNHTSLTTASDGGDLDVLGDQKRIVVFSGKTISGQDFHEQAPYTPKPVVTKIEMNELHNAAIFSDPQRADWIDALRKAVQYGERFESSRDTVPAELKIYAELLCLRMAEDSTKEGWGAQMSLFQKAATSPLETTLAFYLLGNQYLEDAQTLMRQGDIPAASAELKTAVDYLNQGIELGQPLCKAKKGALLTARRKSYQDAGYHGLVVPGGSSEEGLRLLDEAYKELSLDYLHNAYKSVGDAGLQDRSRAFEAQLAYAMGLCWQFGLGTGTVAIPVEKSYPSLRLMEKRAFDNACNQFDQAIAKNKKYAPSYGRWLVLQVQGLGPVKDEEAWRSKWTATMISRARNGADLGDGFCQYWLARYQWKSNPSIAVPLMKQAALPGKETEQDAGNWLRKNGIK